MCTLYVVLLSTSDAAISYVDEHVGALLEVLEDQNIVNDTIVVFHADHGYGLGEHGYWEKKANFDMIVRVMPFSVCFVLLIREADEYSRCARDF